MKISRAIILFADIQGSTEFGYTQSLELYNQMLRDFHQTCHQAIEAFRQKNALGLDRLMASCRGDECCVFLHDGEGFEDELLAMNLAIYLKEEWKQSDFCRLNWDAAGTGMIPQVDLRIGIGSGKVVLDEDVWTGMPTLEGIVISEAKRIEDQAHLARETLIVVKWDIQTACLQAGVGVKFGHPIRLKGKGIPGHHDLPLYPVESYAKWKAIQEEVMPSPITYREKLSHAVALSLSGDQEAALKEYNELLTQRPNHLGTLNNRGNALVHLGRNEEALKDYNRSLQLRPHDPVVLYNRGLALRKLGKLEEALVDYTRLLELRPDDPEALNNRGNALADLGRYEEALQDYNHSLELRPDYPATLDNRGNALADLGRYEEAIQDYNRSLELRPGDVATLNNRGDALAHLGRYEQAMQDHHHALRLRPGYSPALFNRACLGALSGHFAEALNDLAQAIKADPSLQQEARRDKDFDRMRADPEFGPQFRSLVGEERQ